MYVPRVGGVGLEPPRAAEETRAEPHHAALSGRWTLRGDLGGSRADPELGERYGRVAENLQGARLCGEGDSDQSSGSGRCSL